MVRPQRRKLEADLGIRVMGWMAGVLVNVMQSPGARPVVCKIVTLI